MVRVKNEQKPPKLKHVYLTLIHNESWISVEEVQRWMTWTLVLLLTFPGCLCSFLCLGENHEEHHPHQDGPSLSHYCDTEKHHHCCSHSDEQNLGSIISESQLDSSFRLEQFNSSSFYCVDEFRSIKTIPPPPFSLRRTLTGRETLRLCHRLII